MYATTTFAETCVVLHGNIVKSNLRGKMLHNVAMATLRCAIMNLTMGKEGADCEGTLQAAINPDYVVLAGSLERQFKSVNNCVLQEWLGDRKDPY